jgi:hypothetical protein
VIRRPLATTVAAVLLAASLAWLGAQPATADDLPPPVLPSGLGDPSLVNPGAATATPSSGPTYVLTPGSPGTALPPPQPTSSPGHLRHRHRRTAPATTRPAVSVAAPVAVDAALPPVENRVLLAVAGTLLMLVLSEFTRLRRRVR